MVDNLHKLSRVTSTVNSYNVRVANGSVIPATHVGEMDVEVMAKYIRKGKRSKCARRSCTLLMCW